MFGSFDELGSLFNQKEQKTIIALCLIIQLLKILEDQEKRGDEDIN
jgi:hypothetical protein